MKTLTIFYDARCGLCSSVRKWLSSQPAFVNLEFLPYDSPAASGRCPDISRLQAYREIVVMADTGEVWQGAGAWVMCLWALREYREWSARFSGPTMQAVARKIVHLISGNRLSISHLLGLRADRELEGVLELEPTETDSSASCHVP